MITAILSDVDMDGCSATILANKSYKIDIFEHGRYAKLDDNLEKLKRQGAEHLICADLCFTNDQLMWCLKNFKQVDYYDHHEGSIAMAKKLGSNLPRFKHFVHDGSQCTAYLMYDANKANLNTPEFAALANLVNTYDLWLIDNLLFEKAYDLNTIYWSLGYYDFLQRFENGFNGFTKSEKDKIADFRKRRDAEISEANKTRIDLNSGSAIWICQNKNIINDFTLAYPDHMVYYMLRYDDGRKCCALSIRLRKYGKWEGKIDLNAMAQMTWKKGFISPDTVVSCGGHKGAAGVDFAKRATGLDVENFIAEMESFIHAEMS